MVDTRDLKSLVRLGRTSSSLVLGINACPFINFIPIKLQIALLSIFSVVLFCTKASQQLSQLLLLN